MGKITLRVLSSGEFWKGLSSPIPSIHQIKLKEKGTPDPTQAQLHRSWGAAVHPCICIASYMLTTKLGSLKGNGLAAFSTGPELNSEDAILFSLTASMLTPLKHRKGKNIFEAIPGGFFTSVFNKTDMQGAQGSSRRLPWRLGNTADTSRSPGAEPRACCPVPAVS